MGKRERGHCKNCNLDVGEENLSSEKLCYECAKRLMVENFDYMWSLGHPKARV